MKEFNILDIFHINMKIVCFNQNIMSGKGFEFVSYNDYGETIDYTIIHSYVVFEGDRAFACIEPRYGYIYSIKSSKSNIKKSDDIYLFPLTYGYN